jgi:heme exporter protein D
MQLCVVFNALMSVGMCSALGQILRIIFSCCFLLCFGWVLYGHFVVFNYVFSCVCVCVCVCVRMCVCMCVRETETDRQRKTERQREKRDRKNQKEKRQRKICMCAMCPNMYPSELLCLCIWDPKKDVSRVSLWLPTLQSETGFSLTLKLAASARLASQ